MAKWGRLLQQAADTGKKSVPTSAREKMAQRDTRRAEYQRTGVRIGPDPKVPAKVVTRESQRTAKEEGRYESYKPALPDTVIAPGVRPLDVDTLSVLDILESTGDPRVSPEALAQSRELKRAARREAHDIAPTIIPEEEERPDTSEIGAPVGNAVVDALPAEAKSLLSRFPPIVWVAAGVVILVLVFRR